MSVVRRGLVLATAAALGLAASAPALPAAPTVPDQFFARAEALALSSKAAAYTVVPLPLDHGLARSFVEVRSSPSVTAAAAPIYVPVYETAAGGALGTIVGPFLGPVAPAIPGVRLPTVTFCYSFYPSAPGNPGEASCGGAGNAVVGDVHASSGRTRSTGDPDDPSRTSGEASVQIAGITPPPEATPGLIAAGGVASAASARPDGEGRLTAGASVVLNEVAIAGVLNVGSLRSEVSGALSGRPGTAAFRRTLTVADAEVLGIPVTIRPDGVHALASDMPIPDIRAQLEQTVNNALRAAGVEVRLEEPPPPVAADDGTDLTVESGALRVTFRNDTVGVVEDTLLGTSRLRMTAFAMDDPLAAEDGGTGDENGTGAAMDDAAVDETATPAGPAAASPTRVGSSDTAATRADGPAPPAPTPGALAGAPTRTRTVSSGPSPTRCASWRCVYPYFAVLVLGLPVMTLGTRVRILRR